MDSNNTDTDSNNTDTTNEIVADKPNNVCLKCYDKNKLFNLLASYLNVAQKRGAFTFEESAKIWKILQISTLLTK